jgi:transposase
MIDADKRKAIYLLHETSRMTVEELARQFGLSRNTVRTIIEQKGQMPQSERSDKKHIDPELLRQLRSHCQGRVQRMHEILTEEKGCQVSYPTLTRMLRELGISHPPKEPCGRVPDEPGVEMQHDTSPYQIELGGQRARLAASLLYLRYSKRRYLKFYRVFNRFNMKCFLHEALMFWGCSAGQCIIDNTNLARLRGVGSSALIVPEMEAFAKTYSFIFVCHAPKHSNRKAGEERSFYTVETNFLVGRQFASLEDLNAQAFQWATHRLENRPQGKAGLIPAVVFEHEAAFLTRLPEHLPAPYRVHPRGLDPYGYVAFEANYYWVPQGQGGGELKVFQYADGLKIYRGRECLAQYPLPPDGVKNKCFPESGGPRSRPKNRHKPTEQEEKRLRALGVSVSAYLDFACALKGLARHNFLRQLYSLSLKMTSALFLQTIERAAKYRIADIDTIQRIALLQMTQGIGPLPIADIDETFQQRETYREGRLTDPPDLSIYDQLSEPEPDPDHE